MTAARDTLAIDGGTPVRSAPLPPMFPGGMMIGDEEKQAVLAVLDARRKEVFVAGWRAGEAADPDRTAQLKPMACSPEALAARIQGTRALAIGEGAVEFRTVLERSGAAIPADDSELHRATAINHCRIAFSLRASAPEAVLPEYLRLPDAEIARRASTNR